MTYLQDVLSTKQTPPGEPIPGTSQVPNSAGGYTWAVDDWTRLERFLILGSEGGSYYAAERKLTLENAAAVTRCLAADGERVVQRCTEISVSGRAPKNDPALFVLAHAAAHGDDRTRHRALAALPRVCRIGTHLFHFASYADGMRGWGRGLRRAVAAWYGDRPEADLAYQAVKYQQRDGWSHRDLLRLSHPEADQDSTRNALYHWMVKGWENVGAEPHPDPALQMVWAFERAKLATDKQEIAALIRTYGLPREAVPTAWLTEPVVWEALLQDMPLTALFRNLATLTRVGVLQPLAEATRKVVLQLTDEAALRRARVHPIQVLSALRTYAQGHGERGGHTWTPVSEVVDALDSAFYASFGNVTSTGKRWLLALDVSGSMEVGQIAGVLGLTPRVASGAMALITAAVERDWVCVGFTSAVGMNSGLTPLTLSPRQRLDDVCRYLGSLPFGGTDCSLPMRYALKQRLPVDCFVVYTDSETWAGNIHPVQALRQYRDQMGIPARLVVCGMVSNGFSIADPEDRGMLDVCGFDPATPNLIADFASGSL